ncbi:MAG TPA: DNA-binding domain-containing protein [Steroidobacteraceae bacterium]|jgi:hypothetical protein|nr:DNA-binding domain-containing protein [Steroidobacteraceae bacterium]
MSALTRVQGDFQDYLLRGERAIETHVLGTARVPVATRLGIYGAAYRSRLAEALASNFPALAQLLGPEDFATLAAGYVQSHDSPYFSIRYYGSDLPQFLATHADYAAVPVLAELAHWEWAMAETFDAADAAPLTHDALAHIAPGAWAQLRFRWHPSVRRLDLSWNVPQLWQALTDGSERPAADLSSAPIAWLLWREQLGTYFRSLPPEEAAVLDAALRGWPFGELCESLCAELGATAAPARAAAVLSSWVAAGLIIGVD